VRATAPVADEPRRSGRRFDPLASTTAQATCRPGPCSWRFHVEEHL
jgi:hypothetical protein